MHLNYTYLFTILNVLKNSVTTSGVIALTGEFIGAWWIKKRVVEVDVGIISACVSDLSEGTSKLLIISEYFVCPLGFENTPSQIQVGGNLS